MPDQKSVYTCLNCGRAETELPLVAVRSDRRDLWVCAACMPVLIHKMDQLLAALQNKGGGEGGA